MTGQSRARLLDFMRWLERESYIGGFEDAERVKVVDAYIAQLPRIGPSSITCPKCQMTSHHPGDIKNGYCGNCHDWTSCPTCQKGVEDPAAELSTCSNAFHLARK